MSLHPRRVLTRLAAVVTLLVMSLPVAALAGDDDTTPPSAPDLVYVAGYECLEVFVMHALSTDDTDPQSALRYEVYSDGDLVGTFGNRGRGFAYALVPGPTTVTVRAVDTAGNRSEPSNGMVATTTEPC